MCTQGLEFWPEPFLYSKTCLNRPKLLFFKTDYRLMHSAILSNFIKLPFVTKIFVLSIFEWPLKTSFTVLPNTVYATREESGETTHLPRLA